MTASQSEIKHIEDQLDYTFKNKDLVVESINAPGSAHNVSKEGNRRLALIGDAVLDLVALQAWIKTGKGVGPGTKEKSRTVSNQRLAHVARACKLQEQVHVSPSQKGKTTSYQLATAVEALVGAVWQDTEGDFWRVVRLVEHLYRNEAGSDPGAGSSKAKN